MFARGAAAQASDETDRLACTITPTETEGPFFVDHQLERSDLRFDPSGGSHTAGVTLTLRVAVVRTAHGSCAPIADAIIDIWQADASGSYSDLDSGRPSRFLRGYQHTDHSGLATFTTIVPGWYVGRTPHIHFKIRTVTAASKHYEFTSQWYFDDQLLDAIYRRPPYAARGPRPVRNADDGIFTAPVASHHGEANGRALVLALRPNGAGYDAAFTAALDLTAPAAQSGPPPRPPPNGPPGPPGGNRPGPRADPP
jgi:protocatechuate 3,4-dioxygenase beta subunit